MLGFSGKPISSRSSNMSNTNLEAWLTKKKALDTQSISNKQSSRHQKKRGLAKINESDILEPLSENSSERDLSYLSKLQQSTSSVKDNDLKLSEGNKEQNIKKAI